MTEVNQNAPVIGAAVVGLGRGKSHVQALARMEGAKLLAVCDTNKAVADKFAAEYSVDAYTDLTELLKRDDISLIHVCTPSGLHSTMLLQIAEAGKHAMTEKPLDVTLEKIDAAIEAFEVRNLMLGCIFQIRLEPAIQLMKQAIDAGRLGKLTLVNAHVKWFRTDEYYKVNGAWRGTWALDGGGSLMNQSVHTIDLMQWMMGPVRSIVGVTNIWAHEIETEDMGVALVKFANGAIGTLVGSTATYPGFGTTLEIHGVDGGIGMKDYKITDWKIRGEQMGAEEAEVLAKYGRKQKSEQSGASDPNAIPADATFLQIQDMVNAIRENRPPMITGKEGRNAVEIVLAIYESSRTGKEVFLS